MIKKSTRIHFVGIGGIGMSGIAELLLNLGYQVSGSDLKRTEITQRLKQKGAKIFYTHRAKNVEKAEVVIFSSAISPENEEIKAARSKKISVIPRAEMLAELMRVKYSIAVAGAHGKTTTTSMISVILKEADLDPTIIIGGRLNSIGGNAKLGQGEFLVAEADESDGSFLHLHPTLAVITNIDYEHLPYYKNIENIKKAFVEFINHIPFYGTALLCLDDPHIQTILPRLIKRYRTYGIYSSADLMAKEIKFKPRVSSFKVFYKERRLGRIRLNLPGQHNVLNSLGAIGLGLEIGLSFKKIKAGLEKFSGVERRFQIKGEVKSQKTILVDDYAHHPREIEATLKAIKQCWPKKKIFCIFQPHRYTRTRDLLSAFAKAFPLVNTLIITEIYPAGEVPLEGITGKLLAETIKKWGQQEVFFIANQKKIVQYIKQHWPANSVIITMGAGDVYKIGDILLGSKKI
jgi:UDP-N-acetylmuramate--alanine ligase